MNNTENNQNWEAPKLILTDLSTTEANHGGTNWDGTGCNLS